MALNLSLLIHSHLGCPHSPLCETSELILPPELCCVSQVPWEQKQLSSFHDSPYGINVLWANSKALPCFTVSDPGPPRQ